jgi:hypothetical protein
MAEELITQDNLSKELLKSVLDAAYMDAVIDADGDLVVKDEGCYILINKATDRIGLITGWFAFEPSASEFQKLEFVNRINNGYVMVRAVVRKDGNLQFCFDISVAGGITKKAFVIAVKRFCSIPPLAIRDHGSGIVA